MSRKLSHILRLAILVVGALLLLPTVIGTSAPLRALKSAAGSFIYWGVSFTLTGFLLLVSGMGLALVFASCTLCIGLYAELEDMELSREWSAFWSLTLVSIFGIAGSLFWTASVGDVWRSELTELMAAPLAQIQVLNPSLEIKPMELAYRIPAFIFVLFSFWIFLSLRLENSILKFANFKPISRKPLYNFTANDVVIWVFLTSLLGIFVKHEILPLKIFAENVLSVTMTIYFFQGLSVVAAGFKKFKVGALTRGCIYALVIIANQLLGVICMLGLVDYWAEFRIRWSSQKPQKNMKEEVF